MIEIFILATLAFSAFFAGLETAFISSDKLLIELDRNHGALGSEIVRLFTDNPRRLFITTSIGKNISEVSFVALFTYYISELLPTGSELASFLITLGLAAFVLLFFAGFLPGLLIAAFPNSFLRIFSIPALFFFLLFYPFARLVTAISFLFVRIFKSYDYKDKDVKDIIFGRPHSDNMIIPDVKTEQESASENQDVIILRNALDFSNVKLREIMVPRTEIEAVEINSSIEYLKEKFVSTRFSRILSYNGTIDNITGYFEVKDIYKNLKEIKSALRKIAIVPETMAANKLLRKFVNEKINIALVVDEFGGTSGMVTIEDLLEQIVGDIEDEHDVRDLVEKQTGPKEYVLSGRLEIDYLNEKYNLELPDQHDYETLAGMILYFHGSIPGVNEIIRIGSIEIRILNSSSTKINLVKLEIK
jgi:CBS domain containing-hemolysin-like protein